MRDMRELMFAEAWMFCQILVSTNVRAFCWYMREGRVG